MKIIFNNKEIVVHSFCLDVMSNEIIINEDIIISSEHIIYYMTQINDAMLEYAIPIIIKDLIDELTERFIYMSVEDKPIKFKKPLNIDDFIIEDIYYRSENDDSYITSENFNLKAIEQRIRRLDNLRLKLTGKSYYYDNDDEYYDDIYNLYTK